MNYSEAINNARGIGVLTGEQIEAERVELMNQDAENCDCGAPFSYSGAVGAYRASCGAMETSSGRIVRECGKRK